MKCFPGQEEEKKINPHFILSKRLKKKKKKVQWTSQKPSRLGKHDLVQIYFCFLHTCQKLLAGITIPVNYEIFPTTLIPKTTIKKIVKVWIFTFTRGFWKSKKKALGDKQGIIMQ